MWAALVMPVMQASAEAYVLGLLALITLECTADGVVEVLQETLFNDDGQCVSVSG